MTKTEYDKKMAALEDVGFEDYKAWGEACKSSREADTVRDEACKAWLESLKAIDDLEASWEKQESEKI